MVFVSVSCAELLSPTGAKQHSTTKVTTGAHSVACLFSASCVDFLVEAHVSWADTKGFASSEGITVQQAANKQPRGQPAVKKRGSQQSEREGQSVVREGGVVSSERERWPAL
jgi:hypothetical protein